MDESCFFIQSDTLCLLIGAFNPFTFRVTIERYEFSAIVLPVKSLLLHIVSVPFWSVLLWALSLLIGPLSIFLVGLVWGSQILLVSVCPRSFFYNNFLLCYVSHNTVYP